MRLEKLLIEAACFLGVEQDGVVKPRASAFYAVVPFSHDRSQGRGYLVTAKHNIRFANGRQLYVSYNVGPIGGDRIANWTAVKVDRWFEHSDPTVDVAIADWRPPPSNPPSYLGVLTDSFIDGTAEAVPPFELTEGLVTATIGLFHYHPGVTRHTPIVRIGNLAVKPVDRVQTGLGAAEAYLIEARSVGGLSGSPVFVHEEVFTGVRRHPLLGIVQGHFDWREEVSDKDHPQPINTGIAVVTPSKKIMDVLRSPDCVATRSDMACIF